MIRKTRGNVTQREKNTERNRGGRPLLRVTESEYPPSRFRSLSPGGVFFLVSAVFVLVTAGAAIAFADIRQAAGTVLGALFLVGAALSWANTLRKRGRR